MASLQDPDSSAAPRLTPNLALTQRLLALQSLTYGASSSSSLLALRPRSQSHQSEDEAARSNPDRPHHMGAVRRLATLQTSLDALVADDRALKRFLNGWDKNQSLLTPSYHDFTTLNSTLPPASQIVLCLEAEEDLYNALSDLTQLAELHRRGTLDNAGRGLLAKCEALAPRLLSLVEAEAPTSDLASASQKRLWAFIDRYHTHVNIVSELFITLDDRLQTLEREVGQIERQRMPLDGRV